jgi:hypothetical protein
MNSAHFTSHRMLIPVALHHRTPNSDQLRSKTESDLASFFFFFFSLFSCPTFLAGHLQLGHSWTRSSVWNLLVIQLQLTMSSLLPVPMLMMTIALRQSYNQRRKRILNPNSFGEWLQSSIDGGWRDS